MPAARKRSSQELSADGTQGPAQPSMLHRIRNMWQFANLFQFILLFGHALKLDDNLDIEVRHILPLSSSGFAVSRGKPFAYMRAAVGFRSGMPQAGVHGTSRYWPWSAQVSIFTPRPHVRYSPPRDYPLVPGTPLTPHSHELFDEYTRRQFLSKAPEKNPFGTAETPVKFAQFDVFTKVCYHHDRNRSPRCSH